MNKKQKSLLIRIIIAAVFFVPLYLISEEYVKVDLPKWVIIVLFLIPYLTVGYDILRKVRFPMEVSLLGEFRRLGFFREGPPLSHSILTSSP
jgi:hypothetical protein